MKPEDIKITRGITDVQNILKHLEGEAKRARKEAWLKENYSKLNRRKKDSDD